MSEKKENTVMGMETTAVPVESANTTVMQKEAAAAGQPHPKIEVELSPHDDFVLDIAVGKNRNQKNWKPYKITFKQLKERLAKTCTPMKRWHSMRLSAVPSRARSRMSAAWSWPC